MHSILVWFAHFKGLKKSVQERIIAFFCFILGITSICIAANVHSRHLAMFFGVLFIVCLFAVTYFRSKSMDDDVES